MNNGEYHLLVFKVSMYMLPVSPNAIHAVSLVTFHREKRPTLLFLVLNNARLVVVLDVSEKGKKL
jgi:hypothetical protein